MLNVFQPLDTLRNGLRSHLAAVHTSANTSLQNFRKSWPSAMTDSGEHQQQANGIGFASASGSPSAGGGTPLPRLARLSSASLRRRTGCFLIGIAGGTASGKTTVCHKIMDRLQDQCARLIHQDSFYRGLTPEEHRNVKHYNFDHPDAFDHSGLLQCLKDLKSGNSVDVPVYDFSTHARSAETRRVDPADVVIVEGILVLHVPELRDQLNMKVYVDTDDDTRLMRRIKRDVAERGRDVMNVLEQYQKFVKPSFDQFVAPSRRYADVIIPWQEGDNIVAIDLVTEHIKTKLQQHSLRRIYPNLEVMPLTKQIQGMHTIIRDAKTPKNDFTFFADRLNRLVVEAALGLLPFHEKTITTPTGHPYVGVDFARKLCGVSIIRSGESMEAALRTCCKGIKIGKILVVRHHGQGFSRAGTSIPSPAPLSALTTPKQALAAAEAAAASDGPFNSPRRNQQWQQFNAATAAYSGSSQTGSRASSRPLSASSSAAAAAAQDGSNVKGSSSIPGPAGPGVSPQGSPLPPVGYSTEGSAFAAALAASGGVNNQCWIQNSTQDVIYEKLPADIAERHVLLMDPVLSTGNSAYTAIEVLLARGVSEDKIILLCIIAAPEGIHRVFSRFPKVRVVASQIDDKVDSSFCVVPGCGEFGDRYFCD